MKKLLSLILFLYVFSSNGFANGLEGSEYCSCDPPECKEPEYLNSVSKYLYLSHLLGMNLESPEEDALKRIAHEDYRLLKFAGGDRLIRYNDKMAEDRYLACKLGIKEIEGFILAPDAVVVEDPSGDKGSLAEYKKYFDGFKRYISKYNETIMNHYFKAGIEGVNEKERKKLFSEDRQVFKLNWKLGGDR